MYSVKCKAEKTLPCRTSLFILHSENFKLAFCIQKTYEARNCLHPQTLSRPKKLPKYGILLE